MLPSRMELKLTLPTQSETTGERTHLRESWALGSGDLEGEFSQSALFFLQIGKSSGGQKTEFNLV